MIPVIITGIGLCMVRPAQAHRSGKAFSNWLSRVMDQNELSDLESGFEQLKGSEADIHHLMLKASEIIGKAENGHFNHFISPDKKQQIYYVLLQQWNHFQNEKGMAALPPVELMKPLVTYQVDTYHTSGPAVSQKAGEHPKCPAQKQTVLSTPVLDMSLSPMSNGIAIGAP